MKRVWQFVLEAFFPLTCVSCAQVGESLCIACEGLLLADAWPAPDAPDVYSCFAYANPAIRRLLTRYKYHGELAAGVALMRLFQKRLAKAAFRAELSGVAGVVAVPLSRSKLLERGFNQAEALGQVVAEDFGLPLLTELYRKTEVGQLAGKTTQERQEAMKETPFMATGGWPSTVLLVDDVYTTGATAVAARAALQRAGVMTVLILTYAKGAAH